MMKKNFEYLYRCLMQNLIRIQAMNLTEEKKTESCFLRCVHYWMVLAGCAREGTFSCRQDEIQFFKFQKPMFTTEIAYYNFLYHAALFEPPDRELRKTFWLRERERIRDIFESHESFYTYYKQQKSCRDDEYFCLERGSLVDFLYVPPRSANEVIHFDLLISLLQAAERYEQHILEQLALLSV